MHQAQHDFLVKHDRKTLRLWFLWPKSFVSNRYVNVHKLSIKKQKFRETAQHCPKFHKFFSLFYFKIGWVPKRHLENVVVSEDVHFSAPMLTALDFSNLLKKISIDDAMLPFPHWMIASKIRDMDKVFWRIILLQLGIAGKDVII